MQQDSMKLHQLTGYIQTIYLVEYADKLMLLDGCSRADIPVVREFIEQQLKRPFSDLSLVVVTHMHPDHAGAANKLRKITGCKIAASNMPGQWYSGISGRLMHLGDIVAMRWVAKKKKRPIKHVWYSPTLVPDIYLADNSMLPGFDEWQVLHMPGHTDRDLSLLHLPSNKVYVADLFVKVRKGYIPPLPVFYPNRYKASLNRLKTLAPKAIWLAHDGEVCLEQTEYDQLLALAPNEPHTIVKSLRANITKLWRK